MLVTHKEHTRNKTHAHLSASTLNQVRDLLSVVVAQSV
jgi:hypothetical protein